MPKIGKYTDAEAVAAAKTDAALKNPSGMIILWHGTIATIPSGWILCDGGNGTPNLLAKFLEGVATAATNPGAGGGATSKTTAGHLHTGPSHAHSTTAHALTIAEMPSHTHTGQSGGGSGINYDCSISTKAGTTQICTTPTTPTGGGGSHSHGNTGAGGTGNTGSKTDNIADIRPKYYDIAFLMKT